MSLARIRIVLVEPQYGGNIGQCARAMLNTGLSHLVLVAPREHRTDEALWMARDGKSILERAEIVPSITDALRRVTLAIGTTRRVGKYRGPAIAPREAARRMLPLLTGENEAAIVFGREDSGLTSEELDLCQWVVSIPASEEFPSFNLAQAVLICGYELFLAAREMDESSESGFRSGAAPRLAGPDRLERFYAHLHDVLREIRFLVGDQAPAVFRTIRRIFGRANLEPRELKILHGILAQMEWYRGRSIRVAGAPILWAREEDFPEVHGLLRGSGLPMTGLAPDGEGTRVLLARVAGEIAGCVAVELRPDAALLRSLAVAEPHRGAGLGKRLVTEAVGEARRHGCSAVFLLTTSAASYFERLGFDTVDREVFPASLRSSAEWTERCCATAAVMKLELP